MSGNVHHIRGREQTRSVWRRRHLVLTLTAMGAALGLAALLPGTPRLMWNHTSSVPVGLYEIRRQTPARGDLLAIAISGEPRRLLEQTGALRPGELLLKPLAGVAGDRVCREGFTVTVNTRVVAQAHAASPAGALLPAWSGCRRLTQGEVLVIADHPASFDGRYFGPIDADQIVGVARPLLTISPALEHP